MITWHAMQMSEKNIQHNEKSIDETYPRYNMMSNSSYIYFIAVGNARASFY